MGGQLGATYIQMAHDISVITNADKGVRVIPAVGGAAVQNIRDVLLLRGVDLGIATVQSIKAMEKSGEPGTEGLLNKVAYISILSNDELHVLARSEIKSLKDLSGKKVSFNNHGSSTALLAPLVFKALGVDVTPVFLPQADALAAMRTGDVAATVCGCPKPVPAFVNLKNDTGFAFVGIEYGDKLEQDYHPGTILPEDYPQLVQAGTRVNTVATHSVLITYNWPKSHHRYAPVEKFVDAFFSNFAEIQKPPRLALWKSVNLAGTVAGIQRFPAAQEWLERNKLVQAVKSAGEARTGRPTAQDDERLYREFSNWYQKQKK